MDLINTFDHWKANTVDRAMSFVGEEDQGMYKNQTIVKMVLSTWLKLDNRPKNWTFRLWTVLVDILESGPERGNMKALNLHDIR